MVTVCACIVDRFWRVFFCLFEEHLCEGRVLKMSAGGVGDNAVSFSAENVVSFQLRPQYCVDKFINSGRYGTVWLAEDLDAKRDHPDDPRAYTIAIKRVEDWAGNKLTSMPEKLKLVQCKRAYRELLMLKHFQGFEEFVQLRDSYLSNDGQDLYLVMDFWPLSLRDAIKMDNVRGKGLPEAIVRFIGSQILAGLVRLTECRCIHRDLSTANILLNKLYEACISDFGLSRANFSDDDELSLNVVTLPYRPPELLLESKRTDSKIDVWSVGIMFVEALLGTEFVHGRDELHQFCLVHQRVACMKNLEQWKGRASSTIYRFLHDHWNEIQSIPLQPLVNTLEQHGLSRDCIEVVSAMLTFLPEERPSASDILKFSWFQNDEEVLRQLTHFAGAPAPGPMPPQVEHSSIDEIVAEMRTLCPPSEEMTQIVIKYSSQQFLLELPSLD